MIQIIIFLTRSCHSGLIHDMLAVLSMQSVGVIVYLSSSREGLGKVGLCLDVYSQEFRLERETSA